MPRTNLKKLQSEKLVKEIKYVYDNVECYRKRMDEAGIKPEDIKGIEDLHKLPFSYKSDLRDYYPYGLFARPLSDIVELHASSGTTGKRIVVGYTKNDLDMWAECGARMLTSIGATNEDIIQVSYGYGLFTGGFGLHYGISSHTCNLLNGGGHLFSGNWHALSHFGHMRVDLLKKPNKLLNRVVRYYKVAIPDKAIVCCHVSYRV